MKREINWDLNPLIPGIVQDEMTKSILMMGYLNKESFEATVESGLVTFYSRSKKRLWRKGETSGHVLQVKNMALDCDSDTILFQVNPAGPTCHTLSKSCFQGDELQVLENLINTKEKEDAGTSYTVQLLKGERKNLYKKIGEEASEVIVAMAMQSKSEVIEEIADLVFHLSVGMRSREVLWQEVYDVLAQRRKK